MSRIYSPSGLVVGDTRNYVEVKQPRSAFSVCVRATKSVDVANKKAYDVDKGVELDRS